ncbi:unnamed protein product [Durusdinium trenchii]|uniref:Secreted protein n=1 Tax=Durusdinium trenchii TaxID=1381693 RepID=A0ABP0I6E3_9DINO
MLHIFQLVLNMSAVASPVRMSPGYNPSVGDDGSKCKPTCTNLPDLLELVLNSATVPTAQGKTPSDDSIICANGGKSATGSCNLLNWFVQLDLGSIATIWTRTPHNDLTIFTDRCKSCFGRLNLTNIL